jgi:uncharacterized protein YggU (UPF0235/DUF167 family)
MINYCLIKVKVKPDGKKDNVEKIKDDEYFVETKEPPQNNRSNKSVKKLLAGFLKIDEERVILIKGQNSSSKIFKVFFDIIILAISINKSPYLPSEVTSEGKLKGI